MKPSWLKNYNYNLKANFIDATQSRNLASAKLIADAISVTDIADPAVSDKLAGTPSFGQMQGFPIEVNFNGKYAGLYTCNTKKQDVIFGMDDKSTGNAAVSVLDNPNKPGSQLLREPTATIDNVAYSDELHDTPDPNLIINWSKWLDFVNNSSDDDFKSKLASYIDVKSAINVYLFGILSREYDYYSKSVLYLTWNSGKYFYLIPYDMDSTWGQSTAGVTEGDPSDDDNWKLKVDTSGADGRFITNGSWNRLFERMYKLFMPEIKEQYQHLRSTVWQTNKLLDAYRDFIDEIPEAAYEKDHKLWPQIPSIGTNDFTQLHKVIVQRSKAMDKWINLK